MFIGTDGQRWRRLERLFQQAVVLAPAQQAAFISAECGSDDELANELRGLLESDQKARSGWLEPVQSAAVLAGDDAVERHGAFRLDRRLGRGAGGVVYKGYDEAGKRTVTIKRLAARLVPHRVTLYAQEASAASDLAHPNIGRFHGVYQVAGGLRLAISPWYDGETLEQRLQRGPLSIEHSLSVTRRVANALRSAHRANLVHGRVTPSNVLITRSGLVKVLDFGGHHLAVRGAQSATSALQNWLAPETAQFEEVDNRADVWSLAALLYAALIACPVLPRGNGTHAVVDEGDPIWRQLPSSLRRALARGLSVSPAARHSSVASFVRELEVLDERKPPSTVRPAAKSAPARYPQAALRQIETLLSEYIGPISEVIVAEHAQTAPSIDALVEALAEEIDDAGERDAFRRAIAGQLPGR